VAKTIFWGEEMKASYVPVEHVDTVWPLITEYMQGAADYTYGRFNVEDIRVALHNQPQQLWIAYDDASEEIYGAVVTQILTYPRMSTLVMHFTGGKELPKWKAPMLELLQKYAKDSGASVIESYGREGWAKVFKNDGFVSRFMFYELPVEK
jgi:hypothetical protein